MTYLGIKEYFDKGMEELREKSIRLDIRPSLTIVDATAGDPGNQIYIRKKIEDMEWLGWECKLYKSTSLLDLLFFLNHEIETNGVIVQMPTRFDFDVEDIPQWADCDGLTKNTLVMPATVRGIIDYLDDCGFEYAGKNAVVLGRSDIVGKPLAKALLERDMTVSVCHSKTRAEDKERLLRLADLVAVAVGQPGVVTRSMCPNAFVVDVGINRLVLPNSKTKIIGDFVEEESKVSATSFATPVPGGVGLLTRLGLMRNLWEITGMVI